MYMYNEPSNDSPMSDSNRLVPDESAATGILSHLNKNELQNLLDDNSKLESLIQDLQQVKNLQTDREMMLAKNKSMAEYNLSFQSRLEDMKREVAKDYEDANKLKMKLAENKSMIDTHSSRISNDTALALLQTKAASSEEMTEQLADEFCDSKVTVETFLENYLPQRTVAHLRQVKVRKMSELLQSPTSKHNLPPLNVTSKNNYPYPASQRQPYPSSQSTPADFCLMPQPTGI